MWPIQVTASQMWQGCSIPCSGCLPAGADQEEKLCDLEALAQAVEQNLTLKEIEFSEVLLSLGAVKKIRSLLESVTWRRVRVRVVGTWRGPDDGKREAV